MVIPMMNICFVQISQWGGSVEFLLQELARRLPEKGFNVHILTNPERRSQLGKYYKTLSSSNILVYNVPFGNALLRNLRVLTMLLKINRTTRLDVIQICGAGTLLPLQIYKKLKGTPLVYSEWTPHHWFGDIPSSLQMKYNKSMIKLADKVVAITDAQKRAILKEVRIPESRVTVIPHGIDLKEFTRTDSLSLRAVIRKSHNISNDDPILLFVGRLDTYKGVEDAIEALSYLVETYPNARLLLVGPPGSCDMQKLMDYIALKKIEGNVYFIGMVERSDLIAYYYASDIFIFPSRLEGFGIVLAEAMAAGLPVIVYDLAPINSVVGDAGMLISSGDTKALASMAGKLLQDHTIYNRCASAGRRKVEGQYDIERVTDNYITLYMDLIKDRAR